MNLKNDWLKRKIKEDYSNCEVCLYCNAKSGSGGFKKYNKFCSERCKKNYEKNFLF